MKLVEFTERKSLKIKHSGRSTNYLTPSFEWGCYLKCAYCYMRRNKPNGVSVATNDRNILRLIDSHVHSLPFPKSPDQTHPIYWTYDIGCNSDVSLNLKLRDYPLIFNFFKEHPRAFGSFATKIVNDRLLQYNPDKKMRIRFSLMPQTLADYLEPNTTKIIDRIKAINRFYDAGWDVHINYSPIIITRKTQEQYTELFQLVDSLVLDRIKNDVLAECIFLTHNETLHQMNVKEGIRGEKILWRPNIQEEKISSYGGRNIRYERNLKTQYVNGFKRLHNSIIPWNKIRYIF